MAKNTLTTSYQLKLSNVNYNSGDSEHGDEDCQDDGSITPLQPT